jgi:hypothetical protein
VQICTVCCGTKRHTEIQCPADCAYLASAREHPAAVVVRRQQHDVSVLVGIVRDFSQRQSDLFLVLSLFLTRYQPSELHPLVDDDVAQACAAQAATYETAARGVIYEQRPASLPAARLLAALKPLLAESGQTGGSAFERDAAVVLRRIAAVIPDAASLEPGSNRAFLNLLARTIKNPETDQDRSPLANTTPRLIVP